MFKMNVMKDTGRFEGGAAPSDQVSSIAPLIPLCILKTQS
ncbi:hypothetical protein BpOF4_08080 [Alkalihalophilus pseudofirmus OF4]|uniref:Uncharacterized protein n=1 Tax=Alkalihalophilus pseudofirmus (strain ATCC BAA-2126 / JCM 17055 / OF4) TaxID=398511 RepID=D3FQX8_ALKPO|nr:hypothetical protein BpOF4_08080 [Alkalihalophilus pseudofirmus OF4]